MRIEIHRKFLRDNDINFHLIGYTLIIYKGNGELLTKFLSEKDLSFQNRVGSLQAKIISEGKVVENNTNELINEWENSK